VRSDARLPLLGFRFRCWLALHDLVASLPSTFAHSKLTRAPGGLVRRRLLVLVLVLFVLLVLLVLVLLILLILLILLLDR